MIDGLPSAPQLPADGRCCGRKPIAYKGGPYTTRQLWCDRCDRSYEFDAPHWQRENFAWRRGEDGQFRRVGRSDRDV